VEGAVSDVHFHEGDRVGTGTVLARIDTERYGLELKRAQANLRQAQAEAERRKALAAEKLVAAEELQRAHADTERLAAIAASSAAARDIAAQNLRRAELRAPRAGMINTRSVETGQFVKTGTVLATIVDTSRLRLRFKVSEAESLRAQPGQALGFKVNALGVKPFTATVYHVGNLADPGTRQV